MRLIDADALKKYFGEQRLDHDFCICGDESTARDLIDDAKTIEAEPVQHGKWIDVNGGILYQCTNCNAQVNSMMFKSNLNYCVNCGAKMET